MLSSLLAPVLALTLAAAPQEQPSQNDEASGDTAKEAVEDKRICRYIRADISSRRKEKVCMTSEQWREFNRGN